MERAMQPAYFHSQYGRGAFVCQLAMIALMSIAIFYPLGFQPMSLVIFAVVVVPIVIVHYVASLLTIEVYGTELRWYFGLGLWRKRVSLTEIASLARVHLPWWYGIGVKYTPRAWIYLVAPGEGIEITLTSGKALRIGTDDAEGLLAALPMNHSDHHDRRHLR